jgi:hypothetical protein
MRGACFYWWRALEWQWELWLIGELARDCSQQLTASKLAR